MHVYSHVCTNCVTLNFMILKVTTLIHSSLKKVDAAFCSVPSECIEGLNPNLCVPKTKFHPDFTIILVTNLICRGCTNGNAFAKLTDTRIRDVLRVVWFEGHGKNAQCYVRFISYRRPIDFFHLLIPL